MNLRQELQPLMDKEKQEIRQYIKCNLPGIKNELKSKIKTSKYWSNDTFMEPPDPVVIDSGTDHKELHPFFANGRKALKDGQYKIAIENFRLLESSPEIREHRQALNRSRDWLAYAFVLNHENDEARDILTPLCSGDYQHPSAYWNLASIEHNRKKQLNTLDKGMQYAPAMKLLMKAVAIGIDQPILNSTKLCNWLSQMPFLEGVVLRYYYTKHDAEQLQEILMQYILRGDLKDALSIPTPSDKPINIMTNIKAIRDATEQYNQLELLAFWLRCLLPHRRQWQGEYPLRQLYYTTCTDTYKELNRSTESAEFFKKEVQNDLEYLSYLKTNHRNYRELDTFKECKLRLEVRLQKYLFYYRNCGFPTRDIGIEIFGDVETWRIRNEKMRIIYGKENFNYYQTTFTPPPLINQLYDIGQALNTKFRNIYDFQNVENWLISLKTVLDTHHKQNSANKTETLIENLQNLWQIRQNEAVSDTWRKCLSCFNEFVAILRTELSGEYEATDSIRHAINRVINNYPNLDFNFDTVDDAKPTFLGDGNVTAFSLRLHTNGTIEEGILPRLTNAYAYLENDTRSHFPLRDNLQLPIVLRPEQSVLLTFQDEGRFRVDEDECKLEVKLTYELFDQEFSTTNYSVSVKKAHRSEDFNSNEISTPYISGREIKVEEIEDHFFGRSKPKQKIMENVRKQQLSYIEGIRRSGKTSLINSIRHEIQNKKDKEPGTTGPELIPVYLDAKVVENFNTRGQMLHSFFTQILKTIEQDIGIVTRIIGRIFSLWKDIAQAVKWPTEEDCRQNVNKAYQDFAEKLNRYLPNHHIIVFLDDFQEAVNLASASDGERKEVGEDILALLRLIQTNRTIYPHLTWLFAGFRSLEYFQQELNNIRIWVETERIQIDFLDKNSVEEILVKPLKNTGMTFTEEAVNRVFEYTQGYPEMVQKMAKKMMEQAMNEKRYAILPADADQAAQEIIENDTVYDSWCPRGEEMPAEQQQFISNLIDSLRYKARPGQTVQLRDLLDSENQFNENIINDLTTRKILKNPIEDGIQRVGFKAPLLELWLKENWTEQLPRQAAIFTDIENLTRATGRTIVKVSGHSVNLGVVIDAIDSYAKKYSDKLPLKFAGIFFNRREVMEVLREKGYNDDDLTIISENELKKYYSRSEKSYDDAILQQIIANKIHDHPSLTDVILVTGDIDFKQVGLEEPLKKGLYVHVLSYKKSMNAEYKKLALQNDRVTVVYLEELIFPEK